MVNYSKVRILSVLIHLLYKLNLMVSYTVVIKIKLETIFEAKRTFLVYISDTDLCIRLPRRTNPKYSIVEYLEANQNSQY